MRFGYRTDRAGITDVVLRIAQPLHRQYQHLVGHPLVHPTGHFAADHRIGEHRQVQTVLLAGSHRHQYHDIARQRIGHQQFEHPALLFPRHRIVAEGQGQQAHDNADDKDEIDGGKKRDHRVSLVDPHEVYPPATVDPDALGQLRRQTPHQDIHHIGRTIDLNLLLQLPDIALLQHRPDLRHHISDWRRISLIQALQSCDYGEQSEAIANAVFADFLDARQRVSLFDDVEAVLEVLSQRYVLVSLTNGNADLSCLPCSRFFKASLKAEDIGSIIRCELKDSPLFLM